MPYVRINDMITHIMGGPDITVTGTVVLVSGGLFMEVTGAGTGVLLLSLVAEVRAIGVVTLVVAFTEAAEVSMVVADDKKVFMVCKLKALPENGRAFSLLMIYGLNCQLSIFILLCLPDRKQ